MEEGQDRDVIFEKCACDECRHYYGEGKCLAFPEGIPLAIQSGDIEHCVTITGDKGVIFEPMD
ncbi:MAG: cytoplasmic protein [Proteobacteria bacterium]|nr:cytoplasmic protein [Pseudomonadota bacterium]MBU2467127.1 cytoplasmic protein [Pseudomonadota bacterium]